MRVGVSNMLSEELLGNFEPAEGFEAVYQQLRLLDLHTNTSKQTFVSVLGFSVGAGSHSSRVHCYGPFMTT